MFLSASSVMRLCALATLSPLLIGAASCGHKSNDAASGKGSAGKPKFVTAEAYIVKPVAYSPTYTASGQLMANEMIEMYPEVAGRVTNIFFAEGARVHKGQLLLQINDADIKAQVAKLQAQRSLQQTTLQRSEQLVKIGGISRADYDAAKTNVQGINADIATTQATLAKLQIRAPFDGIIGLRNVSPGAIVTTSTAVATLQQVSPLKMDFSVPDQYRGDLHLGQEVHFYVDGNQDTLSGRIAAIEPGADPVTHTVRARAIVPNEDRKLTAGSFAHVVIPFGTSNNSILIPTQSIIPTTRDKKVAILRAGKAVLQTVQTGDRTADQVQITTGLRMGDTVLTTGLMQVKQGAEIKVRKTR